MISKIYLIAFVLFGFQYSISQTLPEVVSLEEALAFGEQNNRNIKKQHRIF